MTLAEMVNARCEALDLTHAEGLSRRLELGRASIGRVLSGQRRLTTSLALRLAAVLGLEVRALLAAAPVVTAKRVTGGRRG